MIGQMLTWYVISLTMTHDNYWGVLAMKSMVTRTVSAGKGVIETHTETERFLLGRYHGPWKVLMMISGEGVAELEARMADRSLGMQAVRVLFAMLGTVKLHGGNQVQAGRKDLARQLGMTESNVSAAVKKLVECGFVEPPRLRFSPYTISPRFAWYGATKDLKVALKDRGMLGVDGMMRAKEAA